jgi:hypothetical protein
MSVPILFLMLRMVSMAMFWSPLVASESPHPRERVRWS